MKGQLRIDPPTPNHLVLPEKTQIARESAPDANRVLRFNFKSFTNAHAAKLNYTMN